MSSSRNIDDTKIKCYIECWIDGMLIDKEYGELFMLATHRTEISGNCQVCNKKAERLHYTNFCESCNTKLIDQLLREVNSHLYDPE